MCPELFWRVSPRETSIIISGANERLVREHNERAWLAWHIAALQRSKKMPTLKSMLAKKASTKRQSWQEIQAVMGQWVTHTQRVARQRKKITSKQK